MILFIQGDILFAMGWILSPFQDCLQSLLAGIAHIVQLGTICNECDDKDAGFIDILKISIILQTFDYICKILYSVHEKIKGSFSHER